ncbi:MAG TPA: type VI secretion system domain-containing protein, partial [Candidatus Sumerlaeota bacterium]|nr:type VI secretion system domain-containing protein [Candidatus Sumerlaeota bacterium]
PLADAATQNWIQDVVLADSGGGGGGSARAGALSTDGADGLGEALDDARSLASEGRLADALRKLQEGARSRDSGRARFLWRMAQAQLAADNGKAKQMAPVWEDLVGEIDRRQLESWEPDLCLAVFRALWQATRGDKERAELNQEMHRRLCRLDPAMALEG